MDKEKLKEKIAEVISLASTDRSQAEFHRIYEIIEEMNLEEMNELDEKLILTERDFEDPPQNMLVATVTRLNWKKIDVIIEEISRRTENSEFQFDQLNELLGQCFFREWTLRMAAHRLGKKVEEIEENPEISPMIKATLCFTTALVHERLSSGDYKSSV